MSKKESTSDKRSESGAFIDAPPCVVSNWQSTVTSPSSESSALEYELNSPFETSHDEGLSTPFQDLERKTSDYLARVSEKANKIVEDAKREVERLKSETNLLLQRERAALADRASALETARKQLQADADAVEERWKALEQETFDEAKARGLGEGLKIGKEEGVRLGREEALAALEEKVASETEKRVRQSQENALIPIKSLVRELRSARQDILKNWEENIMQIAAAIAYQTIMREPSLLTDVPVDLLHEALDLAMNCTTLKIRMNPRDVDNLQDAINAALEETGNLAKAEVVADPKISVGGCVIETSLGVVDERLESRLERIVAELSE